MNFPRFCVYAWTGENDSKTIRVDANLFRNVGKNLRIFINPYTCGHGLRNMHGKDEITLLFLPNEKKQCFKRFLLTMYLPYSKMFK